MVFPSYQYNTMASPPSGIKYMETTYDRIPQENFVNILIDNLRISHNASGLEANIGLLVA